MLAVVSRVSSAVLTSQNGHFAAIEAGLLVLVGIAPEDSVRQVEWLSQKLLKLRVFPNEAGKMHHCLLDIGGELLCVSQFTLLGDTKKGNRPSFQGAAPPRFANLLFKQLCQSLFEKLGNKLKTGDFGSYMDIKVAMDGPVTLILNSTQSSQ